MIYALTFFGIILGTSLLWLAVAGDFPQGIPLIVIWVIALAALFAVGYKRLYMDYSPKAGSDSDQEDKVELSEDEAVEEPKKQDRPKKQTSKRPPSSKGKKPSR